MTTNGTPGDQPYVLDVVADESPTLADLTQQLNNAMHSYSDCKRVIAEATLALQECIRRVEAVQKSIDDYWKHIQQQ
jgi:ABC-type transporter Mla subunit MlaD